MCLCVSAHMCVYAHLHMHACTYECEHKCYISLSVVCPFVCICMSIIIITIKQLSLAIVNIGMQ